MPRKKKIEELRQAHGKEESFKPSSLDQIWGDTGKSKYGTLDEAEYAAKLKGMNKSDLHSHARSLGIFPDDNYDLLLRKLKQEFAAHVNSYRMPNQKPALPEKISPTIAKILSEGR